MPFYSLCRNIIMHGGFCPYICQAYQYKQKNRSRRFFHGDSLGTRTLDPLIKSQLLYQLS